MSKEEAVMVTDVHGPIGSCSRVVEEVTYDDATMVRTEASDCFNDSIEPSDFNRVRLLSQQSPHDTGMQALHEVMTSEPDALDSLSPAVQQEAVMIAGVHVPISSSRRVVEEVTNNDVEKEGTVVSRRRIVRGNPPNIRRRIIRDNPPSILPA